ncbi:hypothetical protein SMD44_p10135 (plasmid) [Streptomyces alboflavus]|uniref:DUF742 domain-containing protein n=1 Tax=Streptomyces alboflavus TaxID=67267 RepID=A0A291W3R3_9ACTN|nr:DUF742 domain-containing protein [Streptomyces alboflavus]ATM24634.1 hypothetical protein SMD44_p10135 [Streptomyces alboflavus]
MALHGEPPSLEDALRVRPYTLTGGRTRPHWDLQVDTLLAAHPEASGVQLDPESEQIRAMCSTPTAFGQLAGHLRQPGVVARILVSDLLDQNALVIAEAREDSDGPDLQLLEDVLAGLRRL